MPEQAILSPIVALVLRNVAMGHARLHRQRSRWGARLCAMAFTGIVRKDIGVELVAVAVAK
jgi:hypothetical protein